MDSDEMDQKALMARVWTLTDEWDAETADKLQEEWSWFMGRMEELAKNDELALRPDTWQAWMATDCCLSSMAGKWTVC